MIAIALFVVGVWLVLAALAVGAWSLVVNAWRVRIRRPTYDLTQRPDVLIKIQRRRQGMRNDRRRR